MTKVREGQVEGFYLFIQDLPANSLSFILTLFTILGSKRRLELDVKKSSIINIADIITMIKRQYIIRLKTSLIDLAKPNYVDDKIYKFIYLYMTNAR